jgi:ABC-type transport system involved in cytochrome bd biosynthesis fused ATPase/permease subunit
MMVESFGGVSHRHIYTYAEDEANARLIAAAPETARQRDMLLETCQLVSLHCVGSVNLQDIELSVQHGPLGATGKGKATLREVLEAAIAATEKGV